MPQLSDVRRPTNKLYFESQQSHSSEFGNRAGKQHEAGWLSGPGVEQAVELFTRSVDADEYADVWKLFDDARLPVSPELWQDESGKIYMPDLTVDGSAFYGKGFVDAYELKNRQLDNVFLQLVENQFDQISAVADRLSQQATRNNVLLPLDDAFDLHVFPDGSFELNCLDLEYGGTLEDLLTRKPRYAQQRARAPLELSFQGKNIESLSAVERHELVSLINESSKKSALASIKEAARRIKSGQ